MGGGGSLYIYTVLGIAFQFQAGVSFEGIRLLLGTNKAKNQLQLSDMLRNPQNVEIKSK